MTDYHTVNEDADFSRQGNARNNAGKLIIMGIMLALKTNRLHRMRMRL